MNEWTASYLVVSLLLAHGIWSARSRTPRPVWARVALWWALTALVSLVAWSVLACTMAPLWGALGAPRRAQDWALCVAGSSFWAGAVIVFAFPFYGWAAATLGLTLPRMLVPRLAPGHLVTHDRD